MPERATRLARWSFFVTWRVWRLGWVRIPGYWALRVGPFCVSRDTATREEWRTTALAAFGEHLATVLRRAERDRERWNHVREYVAHEGERDGPALALHLIRTYLEKP